MNFYTSYIMRTVPIGGVIPIPVYFDSFNIDIDSIFLDCDGSALLKTDYPLLFAIIGIEYGESNGIGGVGTTHFKVPDYRGMFLRHQTGTAVIGDYHEDTITAHSHTIYNIKNDTTGGTGGVYAEQDRYQTNTSFGNSNYNSSGLETRPDNVSARYCVRYR